MLDLKVFMILLGVLPPTLWTIKVQCNHPEKIREDHLHFCCRHPDGHNDITEACARETGFKLPGQEEEDEVDVTVEQLVKGTCWGKCVFRKYNFFKNKDELDMKAVRKHYTTVHKEDPEYEREMIKAFDHCHGKSEEATVNFMNSPLIRSFQGKDYCDPKPSVIMSCVLYYFFHNCPKARWAHTDECTNTLNFAKKCQGVLTMM